jgi:hypothetical protein
MIIIGVDFHPEFQTRFFAIHCRSPTTPNIAVTEENSFHCADGVKYSMKPILLEVTK